MRTRLLALAFLGLASACVVQEPTLATSRDLIVHGVLDAQSRTQDVIVQQSGGTIATQQPVVSAHVTITTPEGLAMVADEVKDSTSFAVRTYQQKVTSIYRVSLDKYGVTLVPGGRYVLSVQYGGKHVGGSAIVPAPVTVASQPSVTMGAADTLNLTWRAVPYAFAYELSFTSSANQMTYRNQPDTTAIIPGGALPYQGRVNTITVMAVDQNYYDYFRRSSDEFSGSGPITHLDGGIGVFGAVSRISTRVVSLK